MAWSCRDSCAVRTRVYKHGELYSCLGRPLSQNEMRFCEKWSGTLCAVQTGMTRSSPPFLSWGLSLCLILACSDSELPHCDTSDECAPGFVCASGVCLPASDGAPDAVLADAALADVPSLDASTADAGRQDGSQLDLAAAGDAAGPDDSVVDAGSPSLRGDSFGFSLGLHFIRDHTQQERLQALSDIAALGARHIRLTIFATDDHRELVERAHRLGIEVCAVVRATAETTLADLRARVVNIVGLGADRLEISNEGNWEPQWLAPPDYNRFRAVQVEALRAARDAGFSGDVLIGGMAPWGDDHRYDTSPQRANSRVWLLGGVDWDGRRVTGLLNEPALAGMTGYGFHPYVGSGPHTSDHPRAGWLIMRSILEARPMRPCFITEFGYRTVDVNRADRIAYTEDAIREWTHAHPAWPLYLFTWFERGLTPDDATYAVAADANFLEMIRSVAAEPLP